MAGLRKRLPIKRGEWEADVVLFGFFFFFLIFFFLFWKHLGGINLDGKDCLIVVIVTVHSFLFHHLLSRLASIYPVFINTKGFDSPIPFSALVDLSFLL